MLAAARGAEARRRRWRTRAQGDAEPAVAAFCNPNGYPSALQAEVLVTVQTDTGVKVMSEAKLDHLRDDVDNFLESYGFLGEEG